MVNPEPETIRLSDRDEQILAHVRRYRITTQEVARRLFYPDHTREAVKNRLHRLRRAGYLAAGPLDAQRSYYRLTPHAAAALFGETDKIAAAPGVQALTQAYAMLSLCCLGNTRHERIMASEFQAQYPELIAPGLTLRFYYRDSEGDTQRIGLMLLGLSQDYVRVLRKARQAIQRRFQAAAWRERILSDGFTIAIVTEKQHKADRIEQAIADDQRLHMVQFWRVEAREDLIQLRPHP